MGDSRGVGGDGRAMAGMTLEEHSERLDKISLKRYWKKAGQKCYNWHLRGVFPLLPLVSILCATPAWWRARGSLLRQTKCAISRQVTHFIVFPAGM